MDVGFSPVILWTDALIYVLAATAVVFFLWARRYAHLRDAWQRVLQRRLGMVAFIILLTYLCIGFLDSIHFKSEAGTAVQVESVLDVIVHPLDTEQEKTYSAPFSLHLHNQETKITETGRHVRYRPPLEHVSAINIPLAILIATARALIVWLVMGLFFITWYALIHRQRFMVTVKEIAHNKTPIPWRLGLVTLGVVVWLLMLCFDLSVNYHIFGTDKVGMDVFYQSLKSIRTGLVIGTLTTLVMLPFAIVLGVMAGYFRGWVDDVIQYIYTTLSSIPGVLLIAAAVLSLQVYISNNPQLFHTMAERADLRLLALCLILGIMSWTGLCRVLRGETLKLREIDYVQAAQALGVGRAKIILRHLIPNVMHLVLIAVVLDFSTLVLAEAVLTYVGVGVDPTTLSWGNMINSARLELAREPIVWWPLLAAFIFMFILVLSANLFADAVRDAFDPRIRQRG